MVDTEADSAFSTYLPTYIMPRLPHPTPNGRPKDPHATRKPGADPERIATVEVEFSVTVEVPIYSVKKDDLALQALAYSKVGDSPFEYAFPDAAAGQIPSDLHLRDLNVISVDAKRPSSIDDSTEQNT